MPFCSERTCTSTRLSISGSLFVSAAITLSACGGGDRAAELSRESTVTRFVSQIPTSSGASSEQRRVLATASPNIPVPTPAGLLDWAERQFPELFSQRIQVLETAQYEGQTYFARVYSGPAGPRFLGVTPDGRVYGLGDFTEGQLQAYETLAYWSLQVCAANPSACTGGGDGELAQAFAWPVDPANSSRGHAGPCGDSTLGCFWLSDTSETAALVWRDAQPFQQEVNVGYGWHLAADYNLGSGDTDELLPVYAVADGKVAAVHSNACGWGSILMLEHVVPGVNGPVLSVYGHVQWLDTGPPAVGATIVRGEPIAKVGKGAWTQTVDCGSSGSRHAHLHLEIRLSKDGQSRDTSPGPGYTTSRLAPGVLGPQGQTDPNAFIRDRLTAVAVGRLNDTGITAGMCYRAGSDSLVSCASPEAIALNDKQDGMIGRDVTTNDVSDGKAGFSYSLVARPDAGFYAKTECVKDNVTGLTWEGKTNAGGLRDGSRTFNNYGDGRSGDASAFVASVNAAGLCGHSDWRLPTRNELQGLVDYAVAYPGPAIDTGWFPNTAGSYYWSSSPLAASPNVAWVVIFGDGYVGNGSRSYGFHVRLVR